MPNWEHSASRYLRIPREAQVRAILLATVMYGVVFGTVCFLAFVTISAGNLLLSLLVAVAATLIIFLWLPKFGKVPDGAVRPDKKTLPVLHGLIDEISATYGIETPDVWLTEDFMAGYARLGLRRKPTLLLGYSMLAILDSDELLTLLAHELAHTFDGAVTRSIYVSNIATALYASRVGWYGAAKALDQWFLLKPFAWICYLIAAALAEISRCLSRQIGKDYRHAEYVADYHALTISGQRDISTIFLKLSTGRLSSIQTACASANSTEKYAAIHNAFNAISEQEKRNIWAYVINLPGDPYAKHPRSTERIAFLQRFPAVEPQIILTTARFAAIQNELYRWPSHLTSA